MMMIVQHHMTAKVITARPDTSLWKAWALLQKHHIRHLPVIQGRRLVGMITDRSLRQLMPSSLAPPDELDRFRAWGAQVKVGDVMSRKLFPVTPQTPTQEALRIMLDRRVGCTPVLRGSSLVGIVTTRDMLRALAAHIQGKAVVPGQRAASRRKSSGSRWSSQPKPKARRR
ncbi:MAG: CBS domain-containing protein [Candidatus Methylomirabilales bacterium]